jgi:sporulation protein YlmC with PRC-barrel domain
MAFTARGLVGFEAVSQDGQTIGTIRDVISDPQSISDYLVIKYSLFYDVVVPADAVQKRGDTVTVLLARSFLDVVPRVVIDGPLSTEEGRRLQEFYRPRAA